MQDAPTRGDHALETGWVDEILLGGPDHQVCLTIGDPLSRAQLRDLVSQRASRLREVGVNAGSVLAIGLPPSVAFVANLLAAWRIGAQVCLLDHRLTGHEVATALARIAPSALVSPDRQSGGGLRSYVDVRERLEPYPGRPAQTAHCLLQLSSGSTGPSKVIGRTSASLVAELDRYTRIDGVPRADERIVLLASMVHVLGLVGGLLYGLYTQAEVVLPERLTADSIVAAIARGSAPTTVLGVPFHIELLASVAELPTLPQLSGMTTGGELVRPSVHQAFVDRYGVRLGNMYGMTEVGVIATDLFGAHRPAVLPAPGLRLREAGGELLVAMPASPYVGLSDPTRWVDGWLHTRDAGTVDPDTGLVRILGRLDSQISVGGSKVDLTEVEQTLAALPEVTSAIVLYDQSIEAYVTLADPADAARLDSLIADRLAAYKRPRVVHVVDQLPRTATGKLIRDHAVLRASR
jgi:acyl-coenzyme A synthetase/AMP-(fatty) acid ligase